MHLQIVPTSHRQSTLQPEQSVKQDLTTKKTASFAYQFYSVGKFIICTPCSLVGRVLVGARDALSKACESIAKLILDLKRSFLEMTGIVKHQEVDSSTRTNSTPVSPVKRPILLLCDK